MKIKVTDKSYEEVMALPREAHKKPLKPSLFFRTLLKLLSAADLKATNFHCRSIGMERLGADEPCLILKDTGKNRIIWSAAPIEMSKPYMSRQVFLRIIRSLIREPAFTSNAPKFVEVLSWEKKEKQYFAIINEQEESPVVPMYDITIDVKKPDKKALLLPEGKELPCEVVNGDTLRIHLPKLEIFQMIELI